MKYLLEKLNSLFSNKEISLDIKEQKPDYLDYNIINILIEHNGSKYVCIYRSTDSIHQITSSVSTFIDNLLEK